MEDFEMMDGVENLDGDIGAQVNNCCEDCARLEGRVTVAERDIEYMQNAKADKFVVDPLVQDVEWMKANKAEKTTTNALLTEVENLKLNKANKTELAGKADTTYVDLELAAKADRTTVVAQAQEIAGLQTNKAEKSTVEALEQDLATKPNKTYVDSELAKKADISEVADQVNIGMKKLYPVGSIYFSMSSQDPSVFFGFGTWSRVANGRVLVGVNESDTDFNTPEKSGGNKNLQSHTHTATVGAQSANHTHSVSSSGAHYHATTFARSVGGTGEAWAIGPKYSSATTNAPSPANTANGAHTHTTGGQSANHTHSVAIGNAGAGNTQNLQPYLTCYIWERIA